MRNQTFDIMKGLGIIAVIIGHCSVPHAVKSFIFTWHMPLFFLVSGYFFHAKPLGESLRKNFRGLVVPYLATAIFMFLCCLCVYAEGKDMNVGYTFFAILVGSGTPDLPLFGQYFTGAIWFLLAMFWCRLTYNWLAAKTAPVFRGGG